MSDILIENKKNIDERLYTITQHNDFTDANIEKLKENMNHIIEEVKSANQKAECNNYNNTHLTDKVEIYVKSLNKLKDKVSNFEQEIFVNGVLVKKIAKIEDELNSTNLIVDNIDSCLFRIEEELKKIVRTFESNNTYIMNKVSNLEEQIDDIHNSATFREHLNKMIYTQIAVIVNKTATVFMLIAMIVAVMWYSSVVYHIPSYAVSNGIVRTC